MSKKIIKHGVIRSRPPEPIYIGTCPACGCMFEVSGDETAGARHPGAGRDAECPEPGCHRTVDVTPKTVDCRCEGGGK